MAGLILNASTEGEVSLSAATAKTILQIAAPTNQRVKILRWGVFFDASTAAAEPVVVRVVRQTTAGTMTGVTPKVVNGAAESVQTSAQKNASSEPTVGDELDYIEVHPQAGYEVFYPMGQEIIVPGGGRVGIECTAPATVNVIGKIWAEE